MTERKPIDWEAARQRNREQDLFVERDEAWLRIMDRLTSDENGACEVLVHMLWSDTLASTWDLPPIARWEREYRFPRGKADFVLFHADGSITVVEVKAAGDDRTILGGIGQLALYAMQVGLAMPGTHVRRILTAPVTGAASGHLADACAVAGAQFEPLGTIEEHRDVYRAQRFR